MGATKAALLPEHPLKALKRPTVLRECAGVAEGGAKERVDYPGYWRRLCERELLDRERKAAERRLPGARFPGVKTIDRFDFSAQPGANEARYRERLRGEYVDHRENVLLIGNSGTGKAHLATALGFAACAQGRKVRFHTVTALVAELLEARENRKAERLTAPLGKAQVLILDELGDGPFSKAGAELLFDVVSRAYERQSLVVTTNLPFESWVEVMGTERLTAALLDRLTHRVNILEANGESYRLQDAKKRLKRNQQKKGGAGLK